jgi:hypothetical protein
LKKEIHVMLLQEHCFNRNISFRKSWSLVLPFILMSFLTATGAWGAQAFTLSPDDATYIWYLPGEGSLSPTSGHFLMQRTGTTASTADACNSNPLTPGSLTGKVALIRRGTCAFSEKINNATAAGAVGVVIYNNSDTGLLQMGMAGIAISIPAVFITKADGEMIDTQLQGVTPVIMTWTDAVTPVITSVTSTTANGAYGLGSTIDVTLNFNEPVTIATNTLWVTLNTGAILKPEALQSTKSVSTTYTVRANELTNDLTVTNIVGKITNSAGVPTLNPTIPTGQNLGDTKDIAIRKFPWPMFLPAITTGVQ